MRHLLRPLMLLAWAALSLTACASTADQASRALMAQGDPVEAWRMVSLRLQRDDFASVEDKCSSCLVGLNAFSEALSRGATFSGDPDTVAQGLFDILDRCPERTYYIPARWAYARYFKGTERPGPAVSHALQCIQRAEGGDAVKVMNAYALAADLFNEMGQFGLRDRYMDKALETAERHYQGMIPDQGLMFEEKNAWLDYFKLLNQRMGYLASSSDPGAMQSMYGIWERMVPINNEIVAPEARYQLYQHGILHFVAAGDARLARDLLGPARRLIDAHPTDPPSTARRHLAQMEAHVLGAEGDWNASADIWAGLFEDRAPGRVSTEFEALRLAGLAQERAGRFKDAARFFSRAVDIVETRRTSFDVDARQRILSGKTITAYWGLLRAQAALFAANRDGVHFQEALRAARMLRARQFGDLLGIDRPGGTDLVMDDLRLQPDELLVNMVTTDTALVVFAISRERSDVLLRPMDMAALRRDVADLRDAIQSGRDTVEARLELAALSGRLFGPLLERMASHRRMTVIPDGPLNGLPMTMLSLDAARYTPVALRMDVAHTPSISYLIRQRNAQDRPDRNTLFALADPVFPKIHRDAPGEAISRGAFSRAVKVMGLFLPLPETRDEVLGIQGLFPPGRSMILAGEEAAEARVKAAPLADFDYLHFATHGVLGNQIPGVFEPALIMAAGQGEDGYLTLSEVQALSLDADLVVLSACDTGSGEYYSGEGVMGLSRGFLLAGGDSVVVSLWPVASRPTVELMTAFYRGLRSGMSKSASLRRAQLALMNKPETAAPLFWAPFVLIGQ